jgi:hypothetical protein
LPCDLGASQTSYQFLGLAAEHTATNDFDPAHSALPHGLVTLVNSKVTVKPVHEKSQGLGDFLSRLASQKSIDNLRRLDRMKPSKHIPLQSVSSGEEW